MNWGTDWPTGSYRVLYVDPPWRFETYSAEGRDRCADNHYEVITRDDLLRLPVADLCHPEGSVLLLWVTSDQLGWAVEHLIPAWGFIYKSRGPDWIKLRPQGAVDRIMAKAAMLQASGIRVDWGAVIEECLALGMGYYFRQQGEECLLATTVKVPPRLSHGVRQVVVAERREHSRKPDPVYGRIESLFPGPYLEMFARNERPGWDCWGDETGKF